MGRNRETIEGLEIQNKFGPGAIERRANRGPFNTGKEVDHRPEYFGPLPKRVGLSRKMRESEIRMRKTKGRGNKSSLRRVPGIAENGR